MADGHRWDSQGFRHPVFPLVNGLMSDRADERVFASFLTLWLGAMFYCRTLLAMYRRSDGRYVVAGILTEQSPGATLRAGTGFFSQHICPNGFTRMCLTYYESGTFDSYHSTRVYCDRSHYTGHAYAYLLGQRNFLRASCSSLPCGNGDKSKTMFITAKLTNLRLEFDTAYLVTMFRFDVRLVHQESAGYEPRQR
ncbi:hypothetical protein FA13DRAFT_1718146 [Coprinellus micaceus]|uniref:Uncharacterized protein n=1 Tax=Coprinellus micaceus TaxID=71717 RepID=A0A4Y7SEA0_COPMI|nr:hypothetical protein FA13DRAFT_1718146 [Coprinellus micaceus]